MLKISDKYICRSPAEVIDNNDPRKLGRVRVNHVQVSKQVWLDCLRPAGIFSVPNIGDVVYLEADTGQIWVSIASGVSVVKHGKFFTETPSNFLRVDPTNRGLFSKGGNLIELDDGIDTAVDPGTAQKGIRLTTTNGKFINIDDTNDLITISDQRGNLIKINTASDSITITCQNDVNINCSNASVNATGNAVVQGSTITLKSSSNTINGGVVTNNTVNNDPITGIPLTPCGGVSTSS